MNEKENTLEITFVKEDGQKEKYTAKIYKNSEGPLRLHLIDSGGKETIWIK